jgi:hypothetical protein
VFGFAATAPTLALVWFLAQSRAFWAGLCAVALGVAAATLASAAFVMANPSAESLTGIRALALLSVPMMFASPFLTATFGVSAWFSPEGRIRSLLLAAAFIELACSAYGFVHWFL